MVEVAAGRQPLTRDTQAWFAFAPSQALCSEEPCPMSSTSDTRVDTGSDRWGCTGSNTAGGQTGTWGWEQSKG